VCVVLHFRYSMNEVIPALFHTASIWFTLALAGQRYIYVCHAPVARTWCTMSRVKKCIGWISVLAILSQVTRFADREYVPVEFEWRGAPAHGCRMEYSYLVTQVIPIDTYYTAYYGFRYATQIIKIIIAICLKRIGNRQFFSG